LAFHRFNRHRNFLPHFCQQKDLAIHGMGFFRRHSINMRQNTTYERKISSEEAKQGYFFVLKNKLSFFPHIGSPFAVKFGTKKKKAVVESYHCECQGPEEPHEHYFVKWSGLAKGDHIVVKKHSGKQNLYSINITE
jgi:hypothetical protein